MLVHKINNFCGIRDVYIIPDMPRGEIKSRLGLGHANSYFVFNMKTFEASRIAPDAGWSRNSPRDWQYVPIAREPRTQAEHPAFSDTDLILVPFELKYKKPEPEKLRIKSANYRNEFQAVRTLGVDVSPADFTSDKRLITVHWVSASQHTKSLWSEFLTQQGLILEDKYHVMVCGACKFLYRKLVTDCQVNNCLGSIYCRFGLNTEAPPTPMYVGKELDGVTKQGILLNKETS